jgi:hypothetical protein
VTAGAPGESRKGLWSSGSRGEVVYLVLAFLTVVASVLKAPSFPINDPALFEYFGRSMLRGLHLYGGSLNDNKLPSIYLVNALWQLLFGTNYVLHTCAAAAVNLASIALFASALRKIGVRAWALGTFLFAAFFSLPFPQFDYAQHYAVFFIILGIWLGTYGRFAFAGVAIALATTFWLPAALTCVPMLLQPLERNQRTALLRGFLGTGAVLVLGVGLLLGGRILFGFLLAWTSYARGINVPLARLGDTLFDSALGSTIIAMLALLLIVLRRPTTRASRFALIWSGCMLLGFAIPPRFSEHYLLPLTPALAMAIASYGVSFKDALRRPIVALAALALLAFAAWLTIREARYIDTYAAYSQRMGHWIGAHAGSGAVIYTFEFVPEVLLAADGIGPGRSDLTAGPFGWDRMPDVLVFGPHQAPDLARRHFDITAQRDARTIVYVPVCPGRTGDLIIYVVASKAGAFVCRE